MLLGCGTEQRGPQGSSTLALGLPQSCAATGTVTQRRSGLCCSLVIHQGPFGKWQERLRDCLVKPR